jgi:uncharacterized protein (DUF736 family)
MALQKTYTSKDTDELDTLANNFERQQGVRVFATHTDYHPDIGHKITLYYDSKAVVNNVELPTHPNQVPKVDSGFTSSIGNNQELGAAWEHWKNDGTLNVVMKDGKKYSTTYTDLIEMKKGELYGEGDMLYKLNPNKTDKKHPKWRIYHA